ncbi:MAG: response regulator [Polaromonas sp.]|uniref:response regulator n=1 Tax=Polaromonas sp. TaxID=1869339 RepID=UPI00248A489F|nr:response regulator [Polaromonas sp.]MDI1268208.1 response regulator [Polaromonas sp.]MDO9112397.1 response regulator [Polaromonas sp.]MDP1884940.1 response regulator [Polaromonas sp.]MDP2448771.1 response regulator [Polaromonas sp.]MDP3248121.1 response regulator [Polaromonas sp.]
MHDKPILVVEDNPDHLELTVLTLQEQGTDTAIVTARDGAEALDYLFGRGAHAGRDTQKQPAFVLLDMKLPKLSGLDVLRSLRSNPLTALVPVVMLTSSSEQSDIIACYQSGANGFVRKPVDFGDFTEKLSRLQDYWLRVNESIAAA